MRKIMNSLKKSNIGYFKRISLFFLLSLLLIGCIQHVPGIEGEWILNNGSVMVISKDEFYWYQDNTKESYYHATSPTVLTQEDALEAIQAPESNKASLLEKHIYYYKMNYDTFILNGENYSSSLSKQSSEFAFQMNGINSLSIVNLNTNEEFSATRLEG